MSSPKADVETYCVSMTPVGRFLPFNILSDDWPLLGGSGHWDAGSKSRVYDIHERLLSARSGRSASQETRLCIAGFDPTQSKVSASRLV